MARLLALCASFALAALLSGCATMGPFGFMSAKDCMTRVMYFESNRSSADGMLAVGTVVMNRVESGKYPRSVCAVVGQPNQFAPGVLWNQMREGSSLRLAQSMADRILRGYRHPGIGKAMFFHTQGYSYPYTNMHYVLNAGGNSFYEKY